MFYICNVLKDLRNKIKRATLQMSILFLKAFTRNVIMASFPWDNCTVLNPLLHILWPRRNDINCWQLFIKLPKAFYCLTFAIKLNTKVNYWNIKTVLNIFLLSLHFWKEQTKHTILNQAISVADNKIHPSRIHKGSFH